MCLDILRKNCKTLQKYRDQSLSCGNFIKKPSTFRLDINLETDNPSKMNYAPYIIHRTEFILETDNSSLV